MTTPASPNSFFATYASRLQTILSTADWSGVDRLAHDLLACWREHRQIFLCGNGGSAANALHIANDLLYGVAKKNGGGLRAQALSANTAIISCLGNDIGYDRIFSEQLAVQALPGDALIVLSGSGNSPNVIKAIEQATVMGVRSYAVLGFDGGAAKRLADHAIHFSVDDMQLAEDLQLVVGHMVMQWLANGSQ